MNDTEQFQRTVKDLYARVDQEGRRVIENYMDLMRAILGESPQIHYIYAAIALDLITAEKFMPEGKAL